MAADAVVPLCSAAQFTAGGFGDLVRGYDPDALLAALAEGTRQAEDICDRRLAPFTVTETTRASGIDPDEYAGSGNIPMSAAGSEGMSYASSLAIANLVRHTWLAQYPPRYPDMWSMDPQMQVTVIRSYGGTETMQAGQILDGPDDTGHVFFQLGQFIPVGSRIRVTYSGGFTPAVPASLVRSAKYFAAANILRELDPDQRARSGHDPDELYALGKAILVDGHWCRS